MTDQMATGFMPPKKPALKEAFRRAREFLATVESPSRHEIVQVYRSFVSGSCLFFRCTFNVGEGANDD